MLTSVGAPVDRSISSRSLVLLPSFLHTGIGAFNTRMDARTDIRTDTLDQCLSLTTPADHARPVQRPADGLASKVEVFVAHESWVGLSVASSQGCALVSTVRSPSATAAPTGPWTISIRPTAARSPGIVVVACMPATTPASATAAASVTAAAGVTAARAPAAASVTAAAGAPAAAAVAAAGARVAVTVRPFR